MIRLLLFFLLFTSQAWADSKLSALSNNSTPAGSDLTYDVSSGTSYNVTLAQVKTYATSANVGIGTTLSSNYLDVPASEAIGLGYAGYYTAPSNSLIVQGNVGVGTYSPTQPLQVAGTAQATTLNGTTAVQKNGTPVVYSFTGDGVVLGNSASTGAVTASLVSDSQNLFLASPNGSSGTPTFRAIVGADVPTLNQNTTGQAGTVATISGLIAQGTNVTITGSGTSGSPYTIASSGSAGSNYWNLGAGNVGINTTTNNVGIGTISSLNTLNILGNVGIGTFGYDPYMNVQTAPSGGMIISGNVGIGTWLPAQKLNVNGAILVNGSGNSGIGTVTPTGALEVEGGNVGIGTTVQPEILSVGGGVVFNGNLAGGVTGNVGIGTVTTGAGATCDSTCNTAGKRCLFGMTTVTVGLEPCSSSIVGDCICLPAT